MIVINYRTPHFVSAKSIFQLNTDFPSKFCVFTVKSPSVTKRSVNEESALKKSKNPSAFFFFPPQNYRLNSFFYSGWKQFQVVEIAKFGFSVTVHCGLWEKSTRLWPLTQLKTRVHFARSMLCCVSTSTVLSSAFTQWL